MSARTRERRSALSTFNSALMLFRGLVDALVELVHVLLRFAGLVFVLGDFVGQRVEGVLVLGQKLAVVGDGRLFLRLLRRGLGLLLIEAREHVGIHLLGLLVLR